MNQISNPPRPSLDDFKTSLEAYLETAIQPPLVLASGWETTIYEFALSGPGRFTELRPGIRLVLRFYESPDGVLKGEREHRTITQLFYAGYPVPTPYLYEPSKQALGAPFLVMDRVAAGPLFSTRSLPQAFVTFSMAFASFVMAQVRLHRISADLGGAGFFSDAAAPNGNPAPGIVTRRPLLDRMLDVIADRIDSGPLPGLARALEVLRERAPQFRDAPASIVHLDYHPQNVLVSGARVKAVIDWVNADCGDRHLDAATTSVILATSAMEHPLWMRENPLGNSLRRIFTSLYIPLYHAMAPMDLARFRYCQAVAAVMRLSTLGMMKTRGAESVGYRQASIAQVTPAVLRLLTRYATRKIGVATTV